jgi:hypothetical protein
MVKYDTRNSAILSKRNYSDLNRRNTLPRLHEYSWNKDKQQAEVLE